MTELDAILEDIRTNPADDLPRLALADWLMERDDDASRSRGEFIHARCRAASLPPRDPEAAALRLRAERLRDEHEMEWLGGLAEHLAGWDFERGMIVADLTARCFRRGAFTRMAANEGWKWVIGVRGTALSSFEVVALSKKPILKSVTSLDLRDCKMLYPALAALAASPHVARLTRLDIGYTGVGAFFGTLLKSRRLTAVRTLLVDSNGISAAGVLELAESYALPRLESLDVSHNLIEDRGVEALARSARFAGLRELRLASCGIGDRGGIALATSNALANLALLDLSDNPLGDATRAELRERFGGRVVLA